MIVTTTTHIEKKDIRDYLGLVSGEAMIGSNIFKEILHGFADLVGGRHTLNETKLGLVREYALEEMTLKGQMLKADAIIGVDLDFHTLAGMLLCVATGTAVTLETPNKTTTPKSTKTDNPTAPRRSLHDY